MKNSTNLNHRFCLDKRVAVQRQLWEQMKEEGKQGFGHWRQKSKEEKRLNNPEQDY